MVDTKWLDKLESKFPDYFIWSGIGTDDARKLIQIARESAEKDQRIADLEKKIEDRVWQLERLEEKAKTFLDRWVECQERLAEYECLAQQKAGIEQSLPDNIEHMASEIARLEAEAEDLKSLNAVPYRTHSDESWKRRVVRLESELEAYRKATEEQV